MDKVRRVRQPILNHLPRKESLKQLYYSTTRPVSMLTVFNRKGNNGSNTSSNSLLGLLFQYGTCWAAVLGLTIAPCWAFFSLSFTIAVLLSKRSYQFNTCTCSAFEHSMARCCQVPPQQSGFPYARAYWMSLRQMLLEYFSSMEMLQNS